MSKTFDPEKELVVARERFAFWNGLQKESVTSSRRYFRIRADYWLAIVDELEAALMYGPNP